MWRLLSLGVVPASGSTIGLDGVLHTRYNSLYAVNQDGSAKWTFDQDVNGRLGPHAEGLENTVYATMLDTNELVSLDGADGSIKWRHEVQGGQIKSESGQSTLSVAKDGTVYLESVLEPKGYSCNSTTIDAVDSTGAAKWTFTHAGCGGLSDVGPDGTLFLSFDDAWFAIQPDTGTVKWSVALDDGAFRRQFATKDGNVFVLQSNNTHSAVSSLSYKDGSSLWKYPFSICGQFSQMTLGRNKEVYVHGVPLSDGKCSYNVLDFNGTALRKLPCDREIDVVSGKLPCNSDVVTYDDEEDVFVTPSGSNVVARSGTDGRVVWNASVPLPVSYWSLSRPFVGRNGTVFVWSGAGGGDSNGASVNAIRSGEVIWSVQTGGWSEPLMVDDGSTYVDGWRVPEGEGPTFLLDFVAVAADGSEKWRFQPDPTPVPVPSSGVTIQSKVSSMCVDLPGGDATNGNHLWMWECYGGEPQTWIFEDGQLKYQPDSTKCVDLLGGNTTNGNPLGIWDCYSGDSQQWGYDPEWGTIYLASSTASDATKCVQIGGEEQGDPLVIWDCTIEPFQIWAVGDVDGSQNSFAVV